MKKKHSLYIYCNFRNGRWRSVWTIREEGGQAEVTGLLKVQVHYYEDGNVQLVSSKEIKETITKSVSTNYSVHKYILDIFRLRFTRSILFNQFLIISSPMNN